MESASLEGLGQEADIEDDSSATAQDDQSPPEEVPQHLRHKWRDEHFRIAKQMSQKSADWLAKRSMTLHIRSLHAYVVHAGLLPWTIPKNKGKKKVHTQNDKDEDTVDFLQDLDFSNEFDIGPDTPLLESSNATEFVPVSTATDTNVSPSASKSKNRDFDPEIAILTVPLNRKPFTLLEMRGIKKNGKVTKDSRKGVPWAPIWNQVMKGCQQTISVDSYADGEAEDDQEMETEEDQLREEDEERKKGKKHVKKMLKQKQKHPRKRQNEIDAEKMNPGQCRPLNVM